MPPRSSFTAVDMLRLFDLLNEELAGTDTHAEL